MEIKQMNEPVAWMSKEDFEDYLSEDKRVTSATVFNFKLDIPLYTHPVNPYQSITNTKIEPTVVSYTHPVKELTDEVIEQVRVAIMGAAYWCADENMPEAYNAVKVCCGQVLGILVKAQEK